MTMLDSNFQRWVMHVGPDNLARNLRCTKFSVYRWLRGEREPRITVRREILRIADGAVSVEDIHTHFAQRMLTR